MKRICKRLYTYSIINQTFKSVLTFLLLFIFSRSLFADDTITVTRDYSSKYLQSQFEIGVTHTNSDWQYGDILAVARAKSNLRDMPIRLQNVHIMGWGPGNPSPSDGVYSWGSLDSRVDLMRSMNADMILTLCTAPGWMKTSGLDWEMNDRVADEYFDEYAALCVEAALRYPDIKYFQIWNEFKGFYSQTLGGWDVAKYTEFYNVIYTALSAARPDAIIGGFYKGFSEDVANGGSLTAANRYLIEYWLDHNVGADFISFDGSIHGWPHVAAPEETLMDLSSSFGRVAAQIRSKTDLPIWVSEYYAANMVGNAQFKAANHASAYYHSLINGTAVALHWDPVGYAPLLTSTSNYSGGKPTAHAEVVGFFNRHFGPGRQLFETNSAAHSHLDVLASASKTLLINKRPYAVDLKLDGESIHLDAYEIRLQEREIEEDFIRGETKSLRDIFSPTELYDSIVSWTSSNSDIVSIDESGTISANSIGTAEITLGIEEAGYYDEMKLNILVEAKAKVTIRVDISGYSKPDWFNTMYFADKEMSNWNFVAMKQDSENENLYYYSDTLYEGTVIRPEFSFGASWGSAESPSICSIEGLGSRTQVISTDNTDFTFIWDDFGCVDNLDPAVIEVDTIANILFSPESVLRTVPSEILGQQFIYDKEADSLWEDSESFLYRKLDSLSPGIFRYPGGVVTNYYHWDNPTGTYIDDNWNPGYNEANNRDPKYWMSVDEYFNICREFGTRPLLGVNIESGFVYNREQDGIDEAVALVEHAKLNGFGGSYYYLGNEPYVNDKNGVEFSASAYANRVVSYGSAIRAVDPSAKLIVGWHRYIAEDSEGLREIFSIAGAYIDIVDFHWYWNKSQSSMALWRNEQGMKASIKNYEGGTFEEDAIAFRDSVAAWGFPDVGLASLEYNAGAGNMFTGPSEYEISLMVGEMLMQFINGGVEMACLWPMHYPYEEHVAQNNKRTLFSSDRSLESNALFDIFYFLKDVKEKKLLSSYSDNDWVYSLSLMDSVTMDTDLYLLNRADTTIFCRIPLTEDILLMGNQHLSNVVHYIHGDTHRADTIIGGLKLKDGELVVVLPAFSISKISVDGLDAFHEKSDYNVDITLMDGESGEPLQGCEVIFGENIGLADADGRIIFENLDYGEYPILISASGYDTIDVRSFELVSDSSLTYTLARDSEELSVLVQVVDRANGDPIYRAQVWYNGIFKATNTSGEIVAEDIWMSDVTFRIEQADYFTYEDTIRIVSDTILVLELTRTHADIDFYISDVNGPLSGVEIQLNDYLLETDSRGIVFVSNQAARKEYIYRIEEEDYKYVIDTFVLEIDTLISVVLEVETPKNELPIEEISIFPNPASEYVNISGLEFESEVQLIGVDGRCILSNRVFTETTSIEVSELPEGCYYLRLSGSYGGHFFKLMIVH